MDPDLEHLLCVIGYTVASHIMCRATLSQGTTGAYEEVLTADLRDVFDRFDVATAYLACQHSKSKMQIRIHDFHKPDEKRLGADFVIAMRGRDAHANSWIHKVVYVQAKRQDFRHHGRPRYAQSHNQVPKALAMASAVDLTNSYFAYYHAESALSACSPSTLGWSKGGPPECHYLFPAAHPPEPYYQCSHPYYYRKPKLERQVFLEPSAYRTWSLLGTGGRSLPPEHEWGVGLLGADYFIDAAGNQLHANLPTVRHVLSHGRSLPKFLLDLATCAAGDNLSPQQFRGTLTKVVSLAHFAMLDQVQDLEPRFVLLIDYDDRRDLDWDDPDWQWWEWPDLPEELPAKEPD